MWGAKWEYLVDEFDLHSEAVHELIKTDKAKKFGCAGPGRQQVHLLSP